MQGLAYHAETRDYTAFNFDRGASLRVLQAQVGGYIERVEIDGLAERGIDAWVNDEGAINGMPHAATVAVNGRIVPLFGDIAFARTDEDGYSVGLGEEDMACIKTGQWITSATQ